MANPSEAGLAVAAALTRLFGSVQSRLGIRTLWQLLGGRRGGTAALASRLGLPMGTPKARRSSMRRVQRYVTEAGQRRGTELPPEIRAKLRTVNRQEAYAAVAAHGLTIVQFKGGVLAVSKDRRRRKPPRLSFQPLDFWATEDMMTAYEALQTAPNDDLRAAASWELSEAFDRAQMLDWGNGSDFGGHWETVEGLVFAYGDADLDYDAYEEDYEEDEE